MAIAPRARGSVYSPRGVPSLPSATILPQKRPGFIERAFLDVLLPSAIRAGVGYFSSALDRKQNEKLFRERMAAEAGIDEVREARRAVATGAYVPLGSLPEGATQPDVTGLMFPSPYGSIPQVDPYAHVNEALQVITAPTAFDTETMQPTRPRRYVTSASLEEYRKDQPGFTDVADPAGESRRRRLTQREEESLSKAPAITQAQNVLVDPRMASAEIAAAQVSDKQRRTLQAMQDSLMEDGSLSQAEYLSIRSQREAMESVETNRMGRAQELALQRDMSALGIFMDGLEDFQVFRYDDEGNLRRVQNPSAELGMEWMRRLSEPDLPQHMRSPYAAAHAVFGPDAVFAPTSLHFDWAYEISTQMKDEFANILSAKMQELDSSGQSDELQTIWMELQRATGAGERAPDKYKTPTANEINGMLDDPVKRQQLLGLYYALNMTSVSNWGQISMNNLIAEFGMGEPLTKDAKISYHLGLDYFQRITHGQADRPRNAEPGRARVERELDAASPRPPREPSAKPAPEAGVQPPPLPGMQPQVDDEGIFWGANGYTWGSIAKFILEQGKKYDKIEENEDRAAYLKEHTNFPHPEIDRWIWEFDEAARTQFLDSVWHEMIDASR